MSNTQDTSDMIANGNARTLLNFLHDEIGYVDRELAEALDVGREHISRIRNGGKGASVALTDDIRAMVVEVMKDTPTHSEANSTPAKTTETHAASKRVSTQHKSKKVAPSERSTDANSKASMKDYALLGVIVMAIAGSLWVGFKSKLVA